MSDQWDNDQSKNGMTKNKGDSPDSDLKASTTPISHSNFDQQMLLSLLSDSSFYCEMGRMPQG